MGHLHGEWPTFTLGTLGVFDTIIVHFVVLCDFSRLRYCCFYSLLLPLP